MLLINKILGRGVGRTTKSKFRGATQKPQHPEKRKVGENKKPKITSMYMNRKSLNTVKIL